MQQTVLFVGHEASRTGAPLSLLRLVAKLVQNGVRCEVLLVRGGPLVEDYRAVCRTTVLGDLPPPKVIIRQPILRALHEGIAAAKRFMARIVGRVRLRLNKYRWRKQGIRAVCLNAAMSGGYAPLADYLGCPLIMYLHELPYGMMFTLYSGDMARLVAGSATFVVPAQCVGRHLQQAHGVASHRIRLIAETVPDPRENLTMTRTEARSSLGIPQDAFVVMMAGTIDWRKGIDLFMGLGRNLADRLPHAHFCWIGAGNSFNIFQKRWKSHYNIPASLAERFHFAGEREDAAELLQAADVFTLTSREDPLPLVHIEASMLEIPIVCFSASGGAPEWIGDGGIVVPFQDVSAMADAVVSLEADPGCRKQMGSAGRALMLKHCTPDTTARQMADILDEVSGLPTFSAS